MSNDEAPKLVGLIGPPGAGKDTVADTLMVDHGFLRVAFADRLRAFLRQVDSEFDQVCTELGYETAKRALPMVRRRLVQVGNAARAHIHQDVWIDAAFGDISRALTAGTPVVVSDVRFANEAARIESRGGVLVLVDRPGTTAETETVADLMRRPRFRIDNGGDLDQLAAQVDALVTALA